MGRIELASAVNSTSTSIPTQGTQTTSDTEERAGITNALAFTNGELAYDHGWLAWSQVLASFLLFFNTWGIVTTYGVFQTYYQEEMLDYESPSTISWIGSIQAFLLLFLGGVTGPLFDGGYNTAMLIFGSIMLPFGLMMTSISTKLWQIMLAQAICVGLACGSLFVSSVAILPQYFKKKRALVNGLTASGSAVGGVVYPIVFRQMLLKINFAWATRILGFMSFATCLASLSLMRVRFKPQEKRALIQLSAFKEPQFALLCLAEFLGFCGLYNMVVFIQPYAIKNKIMSKDTAFYLVAILNGSSFFGRVFPNYLAGFVGPVNVLIPMTFLCGVLPLCWVGIYTEPGLIVLVILYGISSGAFVSVPSITMMSITPDLRDLGTRLGMSFICCAFGALIGTPVGGAIMDRTDSYLGLELLAGMCFFASTAVLVAMRLVIVGPKVLVRV
ncbi:hypothetical protein AJ80_04175 [Polytolypa hystricis UAMH7299]|uniref:Major facilitator superfamily (MFS) profile domain-containing protein n=1 Tax=Polytolypa hystricis (strain UAMH7299) TaxID=1447883 RepID=A0A2B7Y4Y9_POLH7|nr:hypothetical protein AJ80_04175 [Polytolypa hystricis UAMH7299]